VPDSFAHPFFRQEKTSPFQWTITVHYTIPENIIIALVFRYTLEMSSNLWGKKFFELSSQSSTSLCRIHPNQRNMLLQCSILDALCRKQHLRIVLVSKVSQSKLFQSTMSFCRFSSLSINHYKSLAFDNC